MWKTLFFTLLGILVFACSQQPKPTIEENLTKFFSDDEFCRKHILKDVKLASSPLFAGPSKEINTDGVIEIVREARMLPAQDSIIQSISFYNDIVTYNITTWHSSWAYCFMFEVEDNTPKLKSVFYQKPNVVGSLPNDFPILKLSNNFNNSLQFRTALINDSIKGKDYISGNAPSDFSYVWPSDTALARINSILAERVPKHLTEAIFPSGNNQVTMAFKSDFEPRKNEYWGAILILDKINNEWVLSKLVVSDETHLPAGHTTIFDECDLHKLENDWVGAAIKEQNSGDEVVEAEVIEDIE